MKKFKLAIIISMCAVLLISGVGVALKLSGVFAAESDPPAAVGDIVFTAPSGIRWNKGRDAFEVFSPVGLSYIGSGKYAGPIGDISDSSTQHNQILDDAHIYFIMRDLTFVDTTGFYADFDTSFADFGSPSVTSGIIDGMGYTLSGFPYKTATQSFLFGAVYGVVRNFNFVLSSGNLPTGQDGGVLCNQLLGSLVGIKISGSIAMTGTGYFGGITKEVGVSAKIQDCKNNLDITKGGYVVNAYFTQSTGSTQPLKDCSYNVTVGGSNKSGTENDTL